MTLLEKDFDETVCERRLPVLKTARLILRAPAPADAEALAARINDRRIAENTARVPHPYGIEDAERFIAAANKGAKVADKDDD